MRKLLVLGLGVTIGAAIAVVLSAREQLDAPPAPAMPEPPAQPPSQMPADPVAPAPSAP
ncbi:MAG: hypothetical protein AB7I38_10180 [Dehalococcoidia bacterium]